MTVLGFSVSLPTSVSVVDARHPEVVVFAYHSTGDVFANPDYF